MRLARFRVEGRTLSGVVEGGRVTPLEEDYLPVSGASRADLVDAGKSFSLDEVRLLAPTQPSKIVAVGLNYRAHAAEFDKEIPAEPMIFMKPSSAVIGPGDDIEYPAHMSRRVDFEAELAVVIGRKARRIEPEESPDHILGYTCINDVTARDLQGRDSQYARAKGFDTFAPIGPWIETDVDPDSLLVQAFLNGEERQSTTTGDMIFTTFELVSFISQVMTLQPGDVIATGTPSGVGKMKPGDVVEVRIDAVGSLVNTVV